MKNTYTQYSKDQFVTWLTDWLQNQYKQVSREYHESHASGYLCRLSDSERITLQSALVKLLKAKSEYNARELFKAVQHAAPAALGEYKTETDKYGYPYYNKVFDSIRRRAFAPGFKYVYWRFENGGQKWLGFDHSQPRAFNAKDNPAPSYYARNDINTGWYADAYQDNLYYPAAVIFRQGAYIHAHIGYYDVNGRCYIVESKPTIYTARHFAERAELLKEVYNQARSITERAAERARDSDMEAAAENFADEKKQENQELLAEARTLIQALKQNRELPAPVCEVMREKLISLRADMRDNRNKAAKALESPWVLFN